jgi:hypothetical protein
MLVSLWQALIVAVPDASPPTPGRSSSPAENLRQLLEDRILPAHRSRWGGSGQWPALLDFQRQLAAARFRRAHPAVPRARAEATYSKSEGADQPSSGMTPRSQWQDAGAWDHVIVRSFDELVGEAAAADVTGWGFDWLNGRATEERPPWGYAKLLARRLGRVESALDIDTGGGEVVAGAPTFPPRMVATEAWPPNAQRARELLGPRGVQIIESVTDAPDESFELVTARHPVRPDWGEIHRVLAEGGYYFAQHVGPASASELIEHFLNPLPPTGRERDPQLECVAAQAAGLVVTDLRTARCRMEFFDVGAVVWILRKCVWWVPDFSTEKYHDALTQLDTRMRNGEPIVAHSTRHLIEARRPAFP